MHGTRQEHIDIMKTDSTKDDSKKKNNIDERRGEGGRGVSGGNIHV